MQAWPLVAMYDVYIHLLSTYLSFTVKYIQSQ